MNPPLLPANLAMKAPELPPICAVQSVTDHTGRRTVTFSRNAPDSSLARKPRKRRSAPLRLHLAMAPESASSFEPVIQVRSQTKS